MMVTAVPVYWLSEALRSIPSVRDSDDRETVGPERQLGVWLNIRA
jgi:hypothetical protein